MPCLPGERPGKPSPLKRVHSPPPNVDADVDIIAIHGLDTDSSETWVWTPKPDGSGPPVNWLSDASMLPSRVGNASIYTCDWQADLFLPCGQAAKSFQELARDLRSCLEAHVRPEPGAGDKPDRPVLFIASCLGGIILMKVLLLAHQAGSPLSKALAGVLFLATPFQGTSFREISPWAKPILRLWAQAGRRETTPLLELVGEFASEVDILTRDFVDLVRDRTSPCQVFTFYEKRNTELLRRVNLHHVVSTPEPLVGMLSAAPIIVQHPQGLERPHVLMNKFPDPDDRDYTLVYQKIEEFLRKVRDPPALLKTADKQIRESYTDRLKIVRLSGNALPMEQCYINLAIVEQADDAASAGLSLRKRLKVEAPPAGKHVELRDIFNSRKAKEGDDFQPRRIFIRGRPGVGKTTLCKKAVHDFYKNRTWRDRFDRVLWITLRNLTGREDRYDIRKLFHDEFFSQCDNKSDLVDVLCAACSNSGRGKTLFILDGLDEVWHGLSDGNVKHLFILKLLDMPDLIVMSRPSVTLPITVKPFDLELETIGFNSKQVVEYIQVMEKNNASAIQSFLDKRPRIQDLARIPIQLDAICFSWGHMKKQRLETMTDLYTAIHDSIWRRDEDQLGDATEKTFNALGELAFTAMENNTIIVDDAFLQLKLDHLWKDKQMYDRLSKASFLRASNTSDPSREKSSFHFLHLTYQEYFAACHIVQLWRRDQAAPSSIMMIFQKHKYSTRYDMVWRFVAGLLGRKTDGSLEDFFKEMDQEPLDLLGATHHRLIAHCLAEIAPSQNVPVRNQLERRLTGWFISQKRAHDDEFPTQCLINVLQHGEGNSQGGKILSWTSPVSGLRLARGRPVQRAMLAAIRTLQDRPDLPATAIEAIVELLGDKDSDIRWAAAKTLQYQSNLSITAVEAIIQYLGHKDFNIREAAVTALQNQSNLSVTAVQAIIECFGHENSGIRLAAARTLQNQSNLSITAVEAIVQCLGHQDFNIREAAAKTLRNQSNLSVTAVQAIIECLGHEDSGIRLAAAKTLQNQSNLPVTAVEAIIQCLGHQDFHVREAAVTALQNQSNLSVAAVQAIIVCLGHEDSGIRLTAARTLQNQSNLSITAVEAIVQCLGHQDFNIREAAAKALQNQSNLSVTAVEAIVQCLGHQDFHVSQAAVIALQNQPNLSVTAVEAIVQYLGHQDFNVREAAVTALQNQSNLSVTAVQAIIECFGHKDSGIRLAAAKTLQNQPNLSVTAVEAIVQCLGHQDFHVREAAVIALQNQPNLSVTAVEAIIKCFGHENSGIREAAAKTLRNQPNLSVTAVEAILKYFGHKNFHVRQSAVTALQNQPNLSVTAVEAILKYFGHKSFHVREAAVTALRNQPNLSVTAVEAIIELLGYKHIHISQAAAKTLRNQPNLSVTAVEAIVQCLGHQDFHVREAAVIALQNQPNLSVTAVEAIVQCLGHQDFNVREAAAKALQNQSNLSVTAVEAIVQYLGHQDFNVREAAVIALRNQSNLSVTAVEAIIEFLGYKHIHVSQAAAKTLRNQPNLSVTAVEAIVEFLGHQDFHVREAAVIALQNQSNLSVTAVEAIIQCLGHQDFHVSQAAVIALRNQSNLSVTVVEAIIKCFGHEDSGIRLAAARTLQNQSNLPVTAVEAIIQCLGHQDFHVREAAVTALQNQSNLSVAAVEAIIECLGHKDFNVMEAAVTALRNQPNLSVTAVEAVVKCLSDKVSVVRWAAVTVLQSQPNLSVTAVEAVVKCFSDKDSVVRRAAVTVLQNQPHLPQMAVRRTVSRSCKLNDSEILTMLQNNDFHRAVLDTSAVGRVFDALFPLSAHSHISWCIHAGKSRIETEQRAYVVTLENTEGVIAQIRRRQKKHGTSGL